LYRSTTAEDVLNNFFAILQATKSYSDETRYDTASIERNDLAQFKSYDKELLTRSTVNYLIANLTPDSLNSCGFNEYDNFGNRDFRTFSQDNLDFLITLKSEIQNSFNETLKSLQSATKAAEKASIQVYVLEHAKEKKPQKVIDAAVEDELCARELQAEAKEEFMLARRAEEYFRVIPSVYESMNIDAALWGILMTLRTDGYNPYIESRFSNLFNHAQNIAAMDLERYASDV
jgi:hypothetical protein